MKETRFKDTEIGRIPEDWEATSIEKLCTLKARIGWQGLTTGEYLLQGDYILITGTDFKDGYIDWKNCWYVSKWRYDQDSNIQIKEGDVLISKDGTIGKVAFINSTPGPGTLNSGVFVVRPKQKDIVNQGYLSWIFKSIWFKSFIDQLTAGSTINHLYQKDFVNFKLVYPNDISEQTRIASALTSIDNLISSLDKLIEKKKAIKEGTMQQLLTGKKRLKGFNEPWVEKSIDDLCNRFDNQRIPISERNRRKGNIPYYGANGIQDYVCGYTHDGDYILLAEDGANSLSNYPIRYVSGKIWVNNHAHVLQAKDFISDNKYLSYALKMIKYEEHIVGSGRAKLNSVTLMSLALLISPNIQEQKAIAQILSCLDNEITVLEAKRNKYIKAKQGMMQQLLTGKIRLV